MKLAARVPDGELREVEINGAPGALLLDREQRLVGVWSLDIAGGEIRGISSVVNPEKLAHLGPVVDWSSLVGTIER
jgi:RNA polymerase sigma-70 factor (ECF subfamily)